MSGKAIPLHPLMATAALSLAAVEWSVRAGVGPDALAYRTRLCGVALAGAAAFLLDDAAAETVASAPTTLARRTVQRVLLGVAVVATAWGVLGWRAGLFASAVANLDRVLALELAVYVTIGFATAACTARRDGPGGMVGAFAVGVGLLAAMQFPDGWSPLPASPLASGAVRELWIALAATATALAVAIRDPASRTLPALRL